MKNKRNFPRRRAEVVARMKHGDPLQYDPTPKNRSQRRALERELRRLQHNDKRRLDR